MEKLPCQDEVGLKKGPWTPDEDQKLLDYIRQHGHGSWRTLPSKAGLRRCGKSCRLRWTNYLRPDIKRGNFAFHEDQTIIQLHALLGNRWAAIASHLPNRTDNEIKNYWHTHLKKRLAKMGIDPTTHKPLNVAFICSQATDTAKLSHMAQWESARVEAEGRLVCKTKLIMSNPYNNATIPLPTQPPFMELLKEWTWANPCQNVSTVLNGTILSTDISLDDNLVPVVGLCNESHNLEFVNPNFDKMIENSRHVHVQTSLDTTAVSTCDFADDSWKFPTSIVMGNSGDGMGGCWGVDVEEKKVTDCFSNMINVVSLAMDSSMF